MNFIDHDAADLKIEPSWQRLLQASCSLTMRQKKRGLPSRLNDQITRHKIYARQTVTSLPCMTGAVFFVCPHYHISVSR